MLKNNQDAAKQNRFSSSHNVVTHFVVQSDYIADMGRWRLRNTADHKMNNPMSLQHRTSQQGAPGRRGRGKIEKVFGV